MGIWNGYPLAPIDDLLIFGGSKVKGEDHSRSLRWQRHLRRLHGVEVHLVLAETYEQGSMSGRCVCPGRIAWARCARLWFLCDTRTSCGYFTHMDSALCRQLTTNRRRRHRRRSSSDGCRSRERRKNGARRRRRRSKRRSEQPRRRRTTSHSKKASLK